MRTDVGTNRINIAFPEPLLIEFKELVPARKRNQFIVDAVNKEVRRLRLLKAIEDSAGAWSLEEHPDLATPEDIDAYVRKMRESWMPQFQDKQTIESVRNG